MCICYVFIRLFSFSLVILSNLIFCFSGTWWSCCCPLCAVRAQPQSNRSAGAREPLEGVKVWQNLKSTLVALEALMTALQHWKIKGVKAGFYENHNLLTGALSLQTAHCKGVKAACASANARDQPFPLLQQLMHLQLYVGKLLSSWPWFTIQKVRAYFLWRSILLLLFSLILKGNSCTHQVFQS